MRCLCCGQEIISPSEQEEKDNWHHHCVRSFFGTETLPFIEIDDAELEKLAADNAERGLTIPGAQKKLSLHHESGSGCDNRLTLVDYPTGYILKPQTSEYADLPEAEYLAMSLTEKFGIKTVPYALIKLKGSLAYITKRIDRQIRNRAEGDEVTRLAMEDFCQLLERPSEDKYKGSYESCARIIKKYSVRPGLDLAELFMRVITGFLIGNADMHLKNLSLIENGAASRLFELSPAYDILPVNVVDQRDTEELALSLNAKKNKLERADFLKFAEYCELNQTAAEKSINKVRGRAENCVRLCQESYMSDELKQRMIELISKRSAQLG